MIPHMVMASDAFVDSCGLRRRQCFAQEYCFPLSRFRSRACASLPAQGFYKVCRSGRLSRFWSGRPIVNSSRAIMAAQTDSQAILFTFSVDMQGLAFSIAAESVVYGEFLLYAFYMQLGDSILEGCRQVFTRSCSSCRRGSFCALQDFLIANSRLTSIFDSRRKLRARADIFMFTINTLMFLCATAHWGLALGYVANIGKWYIEALEEPVPFSSIPNSSPTDRIVNAINSASQHVSFANVSVQFTRLS